jgi:hypothetical protein
MRNRLAWLASVVLVAASAAADEIYRYTDEDGQTHFTDSYYDVPEQYRDQVKDIGGDVEEGSGRLSVVPGFGSPPVQPGADKAAKGKGKREGKDKGFAAEFQEGFAQGFTAATGKAPSALSPGLLLFMILLVFLTALAIGAAFLKTACNIVGERPLLLGHAMLIVLIQGIAGALASGALNLTLSIAGQPGPTLLGISLVAGLGTSIGVNAAVLKGMHCETWGMAFKVTFTVMLLGLIAAAPFVYCAMR